MFSNIGLGPFFRRGRSMDPVFALFALVMVVAITFCPLTIIWHVCLLTDHKGTYFPDAGLDFSSFSKASTVAWRALTVALS